MKTLELLASALLIPRISTMHMRVETSDWLDEAFYNDGIDLIGCPSGTHCSYMMRVSPSGDCPSDLRKTMQALEKRGFEWVLFERDAPVISGLPVYRDEWE